ncbi:ADP-ribosyl cyclase/cyclic ADP-ribose hydrolase [Citrus sinensis]|uniref:ADP-ribosyl cyclase/cyclic ADP-ribose hydrolase n=1 Tax=Citrus sinensis TaxID=2711 RepID=A0ACB8M7Z3_CITSI|nr:ADP-ribosyl cyclase/cyclic ADP-ribose hydrolase [Citrus sinensis]
MRYQLNRGDEISVSCERIEASAISVIIFSESYASSRWCLDELAEILECKKEYAQIVLPVFYRVDPSDVRNQTGSFGDSFSKLEERFEQNSEKLQTWRKGLREAAGLSGFHYCSIRPESGLINEVVNHILKRLLEEVFRLQDNKNQMVGVESIVEEIESLLAVESKDVYCLGIWGIGGIGKTTIARAIFDKISSDFEGSCFLENVREESQDQEGEDVNPVMKFLNASGFYPEIGISVLVDKSLIVISNNNKITMHDWLQELGRDIVSQESIDPGNRSRLWHHEDIYKVLTYNTVQFIGGISSFNRENKCKVSYLEDPRFTEVKYLHWHGYPLKSMPSNICAEQLVFLEVPNSSIEQLWDGMKHRGKLNQIIHATCKMLIAKTPNPTLIPHLNKLVILNLRGSKSLKSLPAGIFNLEFLTTLDLSGCPKLKRLPEISSSNTSCLFLSGTAIEELPSSIELLLRLEYLDLSDCKRLKSLPSSLCKLKSLEILDLSGCSNLQRLPECLGQLSSLGTLLLEETNIERIPESIIQISVLTYLRLSYCERLQSVRKLPSLIRWLDANNCTSLQSLSGLFPSSEFIYKQRFLTRAIILNRMVILLQELLKI